MIDKNRKTLIKKRFVQVIIGFFLVLGGIGWFSGLFTPPWVDSSFEMPLGQLQGIAVDSSGNLYCASQFCHRVQKYDSAGKFLLGWQIETGGAFRIRITKNDELEVATARADKYFRFSSDGELLEKEYKDLYESFGPNNKEQCQGPDGSVYQIHSPFTRPAVVRTSPTGNKSMAMSTPFHKWIIMGPLPAWLFCMIGVMILIGFKKDKVFKKPILPKWVKRKLETIGN